MNTSLSQQVFQVIQEAGDMLCGLQYRPHTDDWVATSRRLHETGFRIEEDHPDPGEAVKLMIRKVKAWIHQNHEITKESVRAMAFR